MSCLLPAGAFLCEEFECVVEEFRGAVERLAALGFAAGLCFFVWLSLLLTLLGCAVFPDLFRVDGSCGAPFLRAALRRCDLSYSEAARASSGSRRPFAAVAR